MANTYKAGKHRNKTAPEPKSIKTRAWLVGYNWANKNGYDINDCRKIAMGFEAGFMAGRRSVFNESK